MRSSTQSPIDCKPDGAIEVPAEVTEPGAKGSPDTEQQEEEKALEKELGGGGGDKHRRNSIFSCKGRKVHKSRYQ